MSSDAYLEKGQWGYDYHRSEEYFFLGQEEEEMWSERYLWASVMFNFLTCVVQQWCYDYLVTYIFMFYRLFHMYIIFHNLGKCTALKMTNQVSLSWLFNQHTSAKFQKNVQVYFKLPSSKICFQFSKKLGRGGEAGTKWEIGIDWYTLLCIK